MPPESATAQMGELTMTVYRCKNRHRRRQHDAALLLALTLPEAATEEEMYGRIRFTEMATRTDFSPPGAFPVPDVDTAEAWQAAYLRFLETDGAIYERWAALDATVNPSQYSMAIG